MISDDPSANPPPVQRGGDCGDNLVHYAIWVFLAAAFLGLLLGATASVITPAHSTAKGIGAEHAFTFRLSADSRPRIRVGNDLSRARPVNRVSCSLYRRAGVIVPTANISGSGAGVVVIAGGSDAHPGDLSPALSSLPARRVAVSDGAYLRALASFVVWQGAEFLSAGRDGLACGSRFGVLGGSQAGRFAARGSVGGYLDPSGGSNDGSGAANHTLNMVPRALGGIPHGFVRVGPDSGFEAQGPGLGVSNRAEATV